MTPGYSQVIKLGQSVVTSFELDNPAYKVVRVIDIRNRPTFLPGGTQWNPPQTFGTNWTEAAMGSVYGVALDDNTNPNIFVARSTVYCFEDYTLRPDSAIIYKLDGVTGAVSVYVRGRNIFGPAQINVNWIPNTGPGLGNLCFDRFHNQMFVTNHQDGIIYRISDNGGGIGIVRSLYDPFVYYDSDTASPGFVFRGERLWGIGTYGSNSNNVRVYFSRWKSDNLNDGNGPNEIWSIALNNVGEFINNSVRLEITLPVLGGAFNFSNPVSDIEFSNDGTMLLGERSMLGDMGDCIGGGAFAHNSRILEYARDINGFYTTYKVYKIGSFFNKNTNSCGGVDFSFGISDSVSNVNSDCDSIIVGTGDALIYDEAINLLVYGVQVTKRSFADAINFQDYSHFIDLNGNTMSYDKTTPGDIDVYRKNNLCGSTSTIGHVEALIEGSYLEFIPFQISDTLRAYLRNIASPYSIVDSAKGVLSSSGVLNLTFVNSNSGSFYIDLKHRNSIRTWSKPFVPIVNDSIVYDFTTAASQAYGSNMIQKGARWCIYSGDVNQNGCIDGSDISDVDNDVFNFVTGYVNTDVNGDNVANALDLGIVDNNTFNFVCAARP